MRPVDVEHKMDNLTKLSPAREKYQAGFSPDIGTSEFISAADFAAFFRKNAIAVLAPLILAVTLASLYLFLATPEYIARSQILIDPKTPVLREQTREVNFSLDAAQVESQITLLRSEKIAATVIKDLNLRDDREFQGTAPPVWRTLFERPEELSEEDASFIRNRTAIAAFEKGLIVRRVGLSYAIEIAFRSVDAKKAALIANATAEAYLRDQIDAKSESARQGSRWLEVRLAELREQMKMATHRVQAFRANHDYRLPAKNEENAEARSSRGVEGETLEELEATADTYRKIYESFLQAFTASVQQQSYPVSDARVITLAERPLAKSYPRSWLILGFAVLLGLTIGCGIALIRHAFGRTSR
jgi:uncharacterized protein involved in exopolysaccharide biosynthesis